MLKRRDIVRLWTIGVLPSLKTITGQDHDKRRQAAVDSGIYPAETHLLLDDLDIDHLKDARRLIHPPEMAGEGPVMKPELPWEGKSLIFRNSIIYDGQEKLFKFWYGCFDPNLPPITPEAPIGSRRRWAYATSSDGMRWERPELGLVDFQGSRKNNLISTGDVGETVGLLHSVVRDDRDRNRLRRYKSIGIDRHRVRSGELSITHPGEEQFDRDIAPKLGVGLFIAYSADGVRWTMREGWSGSAALIMDGSTLHGYDDRIGKWVLWQRPRIQPKYRTIAVSYSEDFEHWTWPQYGIRPDEGDPPGIQFDQLTSIQVPDGYLGLLAASGKAGKGFSAAEEFAQLVYSRDGRVWTRVSREPFISEGPAGSWNDGAVIPANPILVGDEIFIFYYGKNRGAMWGELTNDGKRITTSALGLAKLRRDRWASISSTRVGMLATRLISFANNELHINADARQGSVRVEIRDHLNRPVPGYTTADCDPMTKDSLDQVVSWRGNRDLSRLIGTARREPDVGRGLRLWFTLERAHLYSFAC